MKVILRNIYLSLILFPLICVSQIQLENMDSYNHNWPESYSYVLKLGNINTASVNLLLKSKKDYFNICPELSHEKKMRFFQSKNPFTSIEYQSNYTGQSLFFEYTQNITERNNIFFQYNRQKSQGLYQNQETYVSNFNMSYWFATKNNRYYTFIYLDREKIEREENGGIQSDSVFINGAFNFSDGLIPDRETINVNLNEANSLRKNKSIRIFSRINLGAKKEIDSTQVVLEKSYLFHEINWNSFMFRYDDQYPSVLFYPNFYIDSLNTTDTSFFNLLNNKFGWNHDASNTNIFIQTRHGKYGFLDYDTILFDLNIGIVTKKNWDKINLELEAHCIPVGGNQSSYFASISSTKDIKKTDLNFSTYISRYKSSLFKQKYFSNHFQWNNNFDFLLENGFKFSVLNKKRNFLIEANLISYKNYIYFNDNCLPIQHREKNNFFQVKANKKIIIKTFNLDVKAIYQKSDKNFIKIPKISLNTSAYFINNVFKKQATLRYGINVLYFSKYYANKYMPSLGLFYLQNERLIGNYPVFNFLLDFKIQNVNIGFVVEHLNSGFMGFDYFAAPNYPIIDRSVRFNIIWRFKD